MIRRRLTLKRVDPWSVLKFGFVVNIALMLVGMLGFWILWIVIRRLGLVAQFCDSVGTIVLDLQQCSLNGGNIFRTLLLLGLLGVVVQTGIMVFGAFLYNLIADLTGGLGFTFLDESGDATLTTARSAETATRQSDREAPRERAEPRPAPAAAAAPRSAAGPAGPPDQSSTPRRPTPDGPPPGPGRPEGGPPPSPTPSSSPSSSPTSPGSDPSRPQSGTSPGSSGPSTDPGQPRRDSSGSLWGDPTRSNDRS